MLIQILVLVLVSSLLLSRYCNLSFVLLPKGAMYTFCIDYALEGVGHVECPLLCKQARNPGLDSADVCKGVGRAVCTGALQPIMPNCVASTCKPHQPRHVQMVLITKPALQIKTGVFMFLDL
jgi:hypothetical protein